MIRRPAALSRRSASIGPRPIRARQEGVSLTSSTPDALWAASSVRLLRPAAISCAGISAGRVLSRCSLSVPVGMRLLLVSEPDSLASTLVRVLAGLRRPHHGTLRIAGLDDPSADGWGRRVAHLGPEPAIHAWMTPLEALRLAAALLELPERETARRVPQALGLAGIPAEVADRPVRRGGPPMVQRTGFAAAMLADPEVLLLDEPLRAVEASERARLLNVPGPRRTVVLASRYPASEAGLASHVAFLRGGRVTLMAPIEELVSEGLPLSTRGIAAMAERRQAVDRR